MCHSLTVTGAGKGMCYWCGRQQVAKDMRCHFWGSAPVHHCKGCDWKRIVVPRIERYIDASPD